MQHSAAATLSRPAARVAARPAALSDRVPTAPLNGSLNGPLTAPPTAPLAAPLAGLAGTDLSRRFRHWRGRSGRRHLFSVFPLDGSAPDGSEGWEDAPRFADAVIMAVGRGADGAPRILALAETGSRPDLFYATPAFRAAVAAGADEVHVHLLADGAAARAAVLRDLAGA